jgi:hypothetical protein
MIATTLTTRYRMMLLFTCDVGDMSHCVIVQTSFFRALVICAPTREIQQSALLLRLIATAKREGKGGWLQADLASSEHYQRRLDSPESISRLLAVNHTALSEAPQGQAAASSLLLQGQARGLQHQLTLQLIRIQQYRNIHRQHVAARHAQLWKRLAAPQILSSPSHQAPQLSLSLSRLCCSRMHGPQ